MPGANLRKTMKVNASSVSKLSKVKEWSKSKDIVCCMNQNRESHVSIAFSKPEKKKFFAAFHHYR